MTSPTTLASGASLPSPPHSSSRAATPCSTRTLVSWARAAARPPARPSGGLTLVMPMAEPSRAGVGNTGEASAAAPPHLRHGLVHGQGGAEHAAAHVRQVGQLEQPLDGPVLPEGPVQDGEDHVAAPHRPALRRT